jgi:hypothetical protein
MLITITAVYGFCKHKKENFKPEFVAAQNKGNALVGNMRPETWIEYPQKVSRYRVCAHYYYNKWAFVNSKEVELSCSNR